MDRVDVDIAIIARDGQVLICRRRDDVPLAGFWEFPGGKRERGETAHACLVREVHEEVGIQVRPLRALPVIEHDYPNARVRLHPQLCQHLGGVPRPLGCQQVVWIAPASLRAYRFPPANARLIEQVIQELALPS